MTPEPRTHAYRPDLADRQLKGSVTAARFVTGKAGRIGVAQVPMRALPDETTGFSSELLYGETVSIFEKAGDWAWVQATEDGYVGYVPAAAIATVKRAPATHLIAPLMVPVMAAADLKSPVIRTLPHQARITATAADGGYLALAGGGFIDCVHAVPIGNRLATTALELALRFLGSPYLWGGRTTAGIDCSALIQLALAATGRQFPRDTDMQRAAFNASDAVDLDDLQPGDLVFWPGHVGIMATATDVLHANATRRAVSIDALDLVTAWVERDAGQRTPPQAFFV